MWSPNNNISLNEKNELYFVDAEMLPMFVQVRPMPPSAFRPG